jgi:hypothetical protein
MQQSCQSLSVKIQAFERKYIEHYIEDQTKLNDPQQTISEIKYRQKMIEDIRSKVTLYKECLSVMETAAVDPACFQDYEGVERLHTRTFKMWQLIAQWKEMKTSLLS